MPRVACSKGCGGSITVDSDTFQEALKLGVLNFSHNVCPKDREHQPTYHVEVRVLRQSWFDREGAIAERDEEPDKVLLATYGAEVIGSTFDAVYSEVVATIAQQLEQARKLAQVAEEGLDV